MQLQLKTWQFVEDYLKTRTGIIIPIGSTEQHGPTGLIGTDALTAEMVGRRRSPSAWPSIISISRARSRSSPRP